MTAAEFAAILMFVGTLLMWAGFVCAVLAMLGAFAVLVGLLTDDAGTVADNRSRGVGTEQADHRSFAHSRTSYVSDRTHDEDCF